MRDFESIVALYEVCRQPKENFRKLICETAYNICLAEGGGFSLEEIYAYYDKLHERKRNGKLQD